MSRWSVLSVLGLFACSEELPGDYFEVNLTTTEDGCNEPDVASEETWEYRVVLNGGVGEIYIDEALMASGTVQGCNFTYRSPLFTDRRDDGTVVRWSVSGDAQFASGDGCDAGEGWLGTEEVVIVSSTNTATLAPGCGYTMAAEGKYLRTVP